MRQIDCDLGSGGGAVDFNADSHEGSFDGSADGVRFGGDSARYQDKNQQVR